MPKPNSRWTGISAIAHASLPASSPGASPAAFLPATWLLAMVSVAMVSVAMVSVVGCAARNDCGDKPNPALKQCMAEGDKLRKEVLELKTRLAQTLASPGVIKTDEVAVKGAYVQPKLTEGNLSQQQVVATIGRNKSVLKACYERAMKKNTALRRQSVRLTLAFTINPTGVPSQISVRPNYDGVMLDCMRKAIKRWRFPSFSGRPVDVESPVVLQPKNR